MVESNWKELKSPSGKEIRYHLKSEDYVDQIVIREDEKETIIKYEIRSKEPYDILSISNGAYYVEIRLENDANSEDPFFTYPSALEETNIDEIIDNIKKYILDLVSNILNLS